MVDIEKIETDAPVAGPYSPGIKAGNTLYISGQGTSPGLDSIKEQTNSVLDKIKDIVEAAGGSVANIVKTTVYLNDMGNFGKMNRAYKKWFTKNGVENFPARTTIEVADLPVSIMLLEIDAIAVL